MEIQVKEHQGKIILSLSGEFDLYEASKVREAVKVNLNPRMNLLLLDMARVSYLDSSGVGTLINLQHMVQQFKGKICICSLQESPSKVLSLTRLTKFFLIAKDQTQGLEMLN